MQPNIKPQGVVDDVGSHVETDTGMKTELDCLSKTWSNMCGFILEWFCCGTMYSTYYQNNYIYYIEHILDHDQEKDGNYMTEIEMSQSGCLCSTRCLMIFHILSVCRLEGQSTRYKRLGYTRK